MDKLEKLRNEINEIDNKILELISTRMEIVEEVAKVKKVDGKEAYDQKREEEIYKKIEKESEKLGLKNEDIKKIFKTILETSRNKQKELLE